MNSSACFLLIIYRCVIELLLFQCGIGVQNLENSCDIAKLSIGTAWAHTLQLAATLKFTGYTVRSCKGSLQSIFLHIF